MSTNTKRQCLNCGAPLSGRIDKIFCTSNCRSAYHFEIRQTTERKYFEVDKQLKINRKVLKKYNRNGKSTLRREVIHKEGFNPNYFTHYWKNNIGQIYLFTYDYGILKIKEGEGQHKKLKYLIVEWQDYMTH